MVALAFCVIGLVLFGVGGSSFMASPQDTIVKVNGQKITAGQFEQVYNAMQRQKTDANPAQQKELMGQALNEIIRTEVLSREAERYGLTVTDEELRLQLAAVPAFQRDGHFDPETYAMVVRRMFGVGLDQFEKNHRKDLIVRKLNLLIAAGVQVSDTEVDLQKDALLAAEKDPKAREKLAAAPADLKENFREKQINLVFADWLNRLNSQLKVTMVSDQFKRRMAGNAGPAQ